MSNIKVGDIYNFLGKPGFIKFIDGKKPGFPVGWETIAGDIHLFTEEGIWVVSDYYKLEKICPYKDIPIDTPGWARIKGYVWLPRHFAGVSGGRPLTWMDGMTSHTGYSTISWDEFTTTKPEGLWTTLNG
jgi:hypothetical protein